MLSRNSTAPVLQTPFPRDGTVRGGWLLPAPHPPLSPTLGPWEAGLQGAETGQASPHLRPGRPPATPLPFSRSDSSSWESLHRAPRSCPVLWSLSLPSGQSWGLPASPQIWPGHLALGGAVCPDQELGFTGLRVWRDKQLPGVIKRFSYLLAQLLRGCGVGRRPEELSGRAERPLGTQSNGVCAGSHGAWSWDRTGRGGWSLT